METNECAICLNGIKNIYITECKHAFCVECINAYSELCKNLFCPLCRNEIIIEKPYYGEKIPFNESSFIVNPEISEKIILSGYNTITRLNKWKFLYDFKVSRNTGFMFCDDREMNNIMDEVNKDYNDGHSGCSMGYTMRCLQIIAYYGLDRYLKIIQTTDN